MAPAAHHQHHHYHQKPITVTQIKHQGTHDITSVYEIQAQTALVLDELHSLSLSATPIAMPPSAIAITPTSAISHTTTSNYPKPSPPTFLYPEPIVPLHVYEHKMQRDAREQNPQLPHLRFAPRSNSLAWSMPTWLVFIMFVIIALAAFWSAVVWLIHYRGNTTGMRSTTSNTKQDPWARWMQRWNPFARSSRYQALHSVEDDDDEELRTAALASAHDVRTQIDPAMSPPNPYLVPPDQPLRRSVRVRSSAEWAEEHRAFFTSSATHSAAPSLIHSRTSSSSHSSSAELLDVEAEAREAQGRRPLVVPESNRSSKSWVDMGLAAVDGAVDRFADRVIRWGDDNGGDGAMLLPLAKGKQD